MGIRIIAMGMAVPDQIQDAAQLAPLIQRSTDWIIQRTGVERRRIGPTMGSPELAAQAARIALAGQETPDLLIYGGGVQHQAIPDTAVFVARALGIEGVPCFSVGATCISFLVALHTANAFLECNAYSRILICSADMASRARNMQDPESAALLGDGAAAALVEWTDGSGGIEFFSMKTWPEGANLAEIRGGGTRMVLNDPASWPQDYLFYMDGKRLLKLVGPKLRELLEDCCRAANVQLSDIDLIVPHQASKAGFKLLARLGLPPARTVNILADYGNCVSAALPMALATAMAEKRIASGQLVLLLGTAAGVSVGGMLLRW